MKLSNCNMHLKIECSSITVCLAASSDPLEGTAISSECSVASRDVPNQPESLPIYSYCCSHPGGLASSPDLGVLASESSFVPSTIGRLGVPAEAAKAGGFHI